MVHRLPYLDYLRSIAILMVLLSHSVLSYGPDYWIFPLQTGGVGVDLFFVLSGWLIGNQLFKELKRNKTIDLKRFWLRRWLRTLPAYYAVLCFSIIYLNVTNEIFEFPFSYLIFIQNYQFPLSFFTISWSLCVEEQFYLFIAPFLLFSRKLNKHIKLNLILFLLILPSIFRYFELYGHHDETHVAWDCCIMGVLLAFIKHNYESFWDRLIKVNKVLIYVSFLGFLTVIASKYTDNFWIQTPSRFWLAIAFGSWVLWANTVKSKVKFIDNKVFVKLGSYIATRSYAMYLIHPEVLALCKQLFNHIPFPVYFILALLIVLAVSEMLYRLIELPFMNARENFEITRSTPRTPINANS
ncbi:MAG: acyltransferase [Paraglaciecola sp.]|uniref:acyltransferase family protein n=1 Tax=Paraglaciecola sp. TaxID=1920173 RepID=UPI003296A7FB